MIYKYDIWKEPDYQAANAEGKSKELLLWQKMIRDSIPINSRKTTDENYKSFITALKKDVENTQSTKDCFSLHDWLKSHNYIQRPISDGDTVPSEQGKGIVNGAMFNIPYSEEELKEKVKQESFLSHPEDKLLDRYAIVEIGVDVQPEDDMDSMSFTYKGNSYTFPEEDEDDPGYDDTSDGGSFVILDTENAEIESSGWVNKEAAMAHLRDISQTQSGKQSEGDTEVPLICNVSQAPQKSIEELREDFGLKSVNLVGNNTEEEAETIVNETYRAFDSLAKALEIKKKNIGLDGTVNIQLTNSQGPTHYFPTEHMLLISKESEANGKSLASAWVEALKTHVTELSKDLPQRVPYGKLERYNEEVKGACWILDQCKKHDCVDPLLNGKTEFVRREGSEKIRLYPVGDEREAIIDTYDKWEEDLKCARVLMEPEDDTHFEEIDVPEPDEETARKLFGPRSAPQNVTQTIEQKEQKVR